MKDNTNTKTGLYFPTDDADDAFCRLFGQVRQLYYLDLDRENGVPVDRDQLKSVVDSILYIALDTEKKIDENSEVGHIDSRPVDGRGGVMPIYREMAKNLKESYRRLRSMVRDRLKT